MTQAESAPEAQAHAAPRSTRRGVVVVAMMLAMFMAAVEVTIVGTALPSIVADLGGFRWFSWVFAVYLLAVSVSTPLYGKLADLYGRKRLFYLGATLFLGGSTLCGFASSMGQLIAFRVLQGLGAGAIQPLSLTVAGDLYPGSERARVQGWISSVWGVASVTGPALGAFLVQQAHWSYVFWVNVPIGILSMGLMAVFLVERVERRAHRVDYAGAALLTVGISALMLALVQASQLPRPVLAGLLAVAAGCAVLLVRVERRAAEPIVPLALLRNRVIALANLGTLLAGSVMIGVTAFLPAYVQGVMGRSPAVAGFVLASMSLSWTLASLLGGRLLARFAFRTVAAAGGIFLLGGTAVLWLLTPERGPLWAGCGAALVGVGMGCTTVAYLVSVQTAVDWNQRGAATSSNLFARIAGAALGAAGLGAVLNAGLQSRLPGASDAINQLMERRGRASMAPDLLALLSDAVSASLRNVYALTAVLALLALLISLRFPRRLSGD